MNQLVFICSPFRGKNDRERSANIRAALDYCRAISAEGNVPFAPHLLFPLFLDEDDPVQRERAMKMSLHMLALADVVNCYGPRPEATDGMRRELRDADRLHKPVIIKERKTTPHV